LQYRTNYAVTLPAGREVLVRNEFCGINYVDTYFRSGLYPSPKPEVFGREGSGVIVALGSDAMDSSGLAVGDLVVYLGTGAYAQYIAVPVAEFS